MNKIGDIIAAKMELLDMKQNEVAKWLNIPYSTFNNYVCNARQPDFDTLAKICQFLKIDLNTEFQLYDEDNLRITNKEEAKAIRLLREVNNKETQIKLIAILDNIINTLYEEEK